MPSGHALQLADPAFGCGGPRGTAQSAQAAAPNVAAMAPAAQAERAARRARRRREGLAQDVHVAAALNVYLQAGYWPKAKSAANKRQALFKF